MGLRSDHVAGRSYAPLGKTPVVRATGQRFGCSMISAITNRGALAFMVFQGKFQAKGFVDLQEPHAYTWSGLVVRIVAKLTALAVIAWANLRRGFSPLSYVNFAW